jgi:anti-anti-sigma factor
LRLLHHKADEGSVIKSDWTILETAQHKGRRDQPMLVKLAGEFDVRYQKILEHAMSACLGASGSSTLVDLSDVTFMDAQCIQELVVHLQLGKGRLVLCDPSQEVELSVVACNLEKWIEFVYTTDLRLSVKLPSSGYLQ